MPITDKQGPKTMRILSIAIGLSLLLPAGGESQEPRTFRVQVSVSATDDIRNQVVSYLNRELRSIGDVSIVEADPDLHVKVVGMTLQTRGGMTSGVVLSVVIMGNVEDAVRLLRQEIAEPTEEHFASLEVLEGAAVLIDHWLRSGSDDALRAICEGIIADFDARYLEPVRSAIRSSGW